jgi:gliding motility-associated-like protein
MMKSFFCIISILFFTFNESIAQSPSCNLTAIRSALTGAGYTEVIVAGQPCALYFVDNTNRFWNDSRARAQQVGAELASIKDAAENTAILAALNGAGFTTGTIWIGLNNKNGSWQWNDGTPVTYTNWATGEPNNSSGYPGIPEDGTQLLLGSGLWNDLQTTPFAGSFGPQGRSLIKINLCPEVSASAPSVCFGASAQLGATTILGSPNYTYQWTLTPSPSIIGNGSAISVQAPVLGDNFYSVVSTDRYGCSATATVTLTTTNCPTPPGCDFAAINTALGAQGWVELNVTGFPCNKYFVNTSATNRWLTAQNQAAAVGASLASVTSAAENAAILAAGNAAGYASGGFWIGFTDRTTEGTWVWEDGNTSAFTNWNPGEPNNSNCAGSTLGEDGAILQMSNGRWNDVYLQPTGVCLAPASYNSIIKLNLCPVLDLRQGGNVNAAYPRDTTICSGQSVNVNAFTRFGSPAYTYSWSPGGATTNPQSYSPTVSTSYSVTVRDRYQCSVTDTFRVNVVNVAAPQITANPNPACGSNTPIEIGIAGSYPPGVSFNWSFDAGTVLNGFGAGPYNVTWPAIGTKNITLSVSQGNCSSVPGSLAVNIGSPPTASITPSTSTLSCTSPGVLLTASSSATNAGFEWTDASTNSTFTATQPGTYYVTVTDLTSLCTAIDSAVITSSASTPTVTILPSSGELTCGITSISLTASSVTSGTTFNWGGGNTSANFTAIAAGTYSVTVTDPLNSCTASAAVTITENRTAPNASVSPVTSTLTCADPSIDIIASSSTIGAVYSWGGGNSTNSFTATAAGNYTITVTDPSNSCTASATANITSSVTPPNLSVAPANASITCNNPTVDIVASSTDPNINYDWGGGNNTNSITASTAGTFTVTATDANGCSATASASVIDATNLSVQIIESVPVSCYDKCDGVLTANASGSNQPFTYQWSNGSSIQNNASLCDGTYAVTVTDAGGCTAADAYVIIQPAAATLEISPADTTLYKGNSFQLTSIFAPYSASAVNTYSWTPASGLSCTDCANPIFTGNDSSIFTLTINYNNGCELSASTRVSIINDQLAFAAPSAFSPNGDFKNDVYKIIFTNQVKDFEMRIYNRWGEKVFESNDNTIGWDGKYKGVAQPSDVYVCYFTATSLSNEIANKQLSISLLR